MFFCFFCFPQQLLNHYIFVLDYFCVFLHLIVSTLKNIAGHKTLLACPIWHVASLNFPPLSISLSPSLFPSPSSLFLFLFSPWARAGLSGVTSIDAVFSVFSHDAPGGDMAISGPVREAVSASPMGWGRGGQQWRCPSLCHTYTGPGH